MINPSEVFFVIICAISVNVVNPVENIGARVGAKNPSHESVNPIVPPITPRRSLRRVLYTGERELLHELYYI